ncbi:ATP-dependent DNA helicase [Nesterenkonia rhizosphaerae]|uniref:DNA 3'-5' helicase n=1 Tax=Nesterenkonia rhizosphaerae TaxID=1348272 RepID=A0ABP9FQ62_9MICC
MSTDFPELISPEALAEKLGTFPPTPEQIKVIRGGKLDDQGVVRGGLDPMLVIAGAGSGKTQTMADRVVYLVANLVVRPDQILGVTFTNKAAGELKSRVTAQLMQLVEKDVISVEEILSGSAYPAEDAEERRKNASRAGLEDLLTPAVSTYHSYANTLVRKYGVHIGVEPEAVQLSEAHAYQLARDMIEGLTPDPQQDPVQDPAQSDSEDAELVEWLLRSGETSSSLAADVLTMDSQLSEHLKSPQEVIEWIAEFLRSSEAAYGPMPSKPQYIQALAETVRFRVAVAQLTARFQALKVQHNYLDFGDLLVMGERIAQQAEVQRAEREQYKVVLLDEFQDTSHAQLEIFRHLYSGGHSVTAVGDPNQSIYGFRGASAGQLFVFPRKFRTVSGEQANRRLLTVAWRNKPRILAVANQLITPFTWDPSGTAEPPRMTQDWHRGMKAQLREITAEAIDDAQRALQQATEHNDPEAHARWDAELRRLQAQGVQLRPGPAARGTTERVTLRWCADAQAEAQTLADELEAAYRRLGGDIREAGSQTGRRSLTSAVLATKRSLLTPLAAELHARGIPHEFVGLAGLLSTPEVREILAYLQILADPARSDSTIRLLAGAQFRLGVRDLYLLGQYVSGKNRRLRGSKAEQAEHATLLDAVRHYAAHPGRAHQDGLSDAAVTRLQSFVPILDGLGHDGAARPSQAIEQIIAATGLNTELAVKTAGRSSADHQLRMLIDYAQQFESEHQSSSLSAFLAWLDAAQDHEKGLKLAEVEPNPHAVQLMTIHASKGLEWNIVAVMGLQEGTLPNPADISDRWTSDDGALPSPMRGDSDSLPQWRALEQGDWKAWAKSATASKDEDIIQGQPYPLALRAFREEEERRLAYVAVTRAEDELILTGARFVSTNKSPREPSRYLLEAAESLGLQQQLQQQIEAAQAQESNDAAHTYYVATWPYEHLDGPRIDREIRDEEGEVVQPRQPAVAEPTHQQPPSAVIRQAAELVTAGLHGNGEPEKPAPSSSAVQEQISLWKQEADFILGRRRMAAAPSDELTASQLTATHLVGLAENPERISRQLRRPIPQEPKTALRRGTAVHAWLEERFGSTEKTLPGFEDLGLDDSLVQTFELDRLRELFAASSNPWAERNAFDVELSFAVPLAGRTIRGQIDAIFGLAADGRELTVNDRKDWYGRPTAERNALMQECSWHLVDWKTGRAPRGDKDLEHKLIQLAVYKHAFTTIFGVARDQVEVSLYYLEEEDPARRLVTYPSPELAARGITFRDSREDLEAIFSQTIGSAGGQKNAGHTNAAQPRSAR